MKKSTLVVALAFGVASVFAQDLTSKKGEKYLPEAEDWAVSIEATPFLNFAGQMLSNAGATAPTWNHLNGNNTIIGKKFKDEKNAMRAIIRLGWTNTTSKRQIADGSSTTAPTYPALPTMKEDKMKSSSSFIGIGAGMEMRRGSTRLQGVYGADFMIWTSGSKQKYEYGNALNPTGTPAVTVANSTNFGSNITTDTYGGAARITEMKGSRTIGLGVRAFIGAEYFLFPKISIAGEFGWGLGFQMAGKTKTTTESIGGTTPAVGTQEVEGNKSSSIMIDTDRNVFGTGNGALRLNLHF